jgi:hypothetical protein
MESNSIMLPVEMNELAAIEGGVTLAAGFAGHVKQLVKPPHHPTPPVGNEGSGGAGDRGLPDDPTAHGGAYVF